MKDKKRIRSLISLTLSFFLTISIIGIYISVELQLGYLNKDNIRTSIISSGYTTKAQAKFQDEVMDILSEYNISKDIGGEIADENAVYIAVSNYTDGVLSGSNSKNENYQNEIEEIVTNYFTENNIFITDGMKLNITEIATEITGLYKQYITPNFISILFDQIKEYRSLITIYQIVSIGLFFGISIVLFWIWRHKHRAMRCIAMSLITSVAVNALITFFIWKSDVIRQLNVGPDFYLDFLLEYKNNGIVHWYIVTGIGLVLCIVSLAAVKFLKYNKSKSS